MIALSSGTEEFWVVDPVGGTVTVTKLSGTTLYGAGDVIPVLYFEATVPVEAMFTT